VSLVSSCFVSYFWGAERGITLDMQQLAAQKKKQARGARPFACGKVRAALAHTGPGNEGRCPSGFIRSAPKKQRAECTERVQYARVCAGGSACRDISRTVNDPRIGGPGALSPLVIHRRRGCLRRYRREVWASD